MGHEADEKIDADQAAVEMGVSRRTLDRWHARRIGPPRISIPGCRYVRYRRSAIDSYLRDHEQQPVAAQR